MTETILKIGRKIATEEGTNNQIKTGFLYTKDPLTNIIVLANLCNANEDEGNDRNTTTTTSGIVCLPQGNNDKCCVEFEFIMRDAYSTIRDIHEDETDDKIWKIIESRSEEQLGLVRTQFDEKELWEKRKIIMEILDKNRLPFVLEGETIALMDGIAKIEPPYDMTSCICRNPMVLGKIQKLIGKN
eukprot:Seg896.7 transcript_id=Seg896.7/GoldUCD/mRNA.D3Y31 product="hypothetical protein" protein_id=Seg896.7/GoldUCD/D3Y31